MFKMLKLLQNNYRTMTYQEGISYLKPFIFQVHPDFFEQHPREKEVNQNSLKLLYNYLHSLDNKTVKNISLQFYLRKKRANKSELSVIVLNLKEESVNNAIIEILTSMKNIVKIDNLPPRKMRIEIPKIVYRKTIDNEEPFYPPRRQNETSINIMKWLEDTISTEIVARTRSIIISNNIAEIQSRITTDHNIADILWLSNDNIDKHFTSLISLGRVLNHLKSDFQSSKIIFTSEEKTGINCYGDIVLSCRQVEEVWRREITNIRQHRSKLLPEIRQLEAEISTILQHSKARILFAPHSRKVKRKHFPPKPFRSHSSTISIDRVSLGSTRRTC